MLCVLSAGVKGSPAHFAKYIRGRKSENPCAQMHPNPGYDDATVEAVIPYFRSLLTPFQEKP